MLSNFTLEYAVNRIQVNQEGLILNGAHQLVVYAHHALILGGSIPAVQKNTQNLLWPLLGRLV